MDLPSYFDQGIHVQQIGYECQNQCYMWSNTESLIPLLCSKDIERLQGLIGTATVTSGPIVCFDSLFDPMTLEPKAKVRFHDIWINLYHICQSKINNENEKTALSFLLTWILIQYPDKKNFLQQLSIIAMFPNEFPSMMEYGLSKILLYNKPHEMDYSKACIDSKIDSYLKKFVEKQPSLSHYYALWKQRQTNHENLRREQARSLASQIKQQWENGNMECSIEGYFSLITSKLSLEEELSQLFRRWREARKLYIFVSEVMNRFERVSIQKYEPLVSLDRDQTVDISSSRSSFILSTSSNFDQLHSENRGTVELQKIDPYTLPMDSLVTDQKTLHHIKEVSFLNDSSFVQKNSTYKEVWDELVKPLEHSFHVACNEADFLILDTSIPEIEEQLKNYHTRAASTYEEIH